MTTEDNDQFFLDEKRCDLCDTYNDVIWKCVNCDEILCDQCKKSHLRSKLSINHIVIEFNNASKQEPDSTIFCTEHPSEAVHIYCKTCNCLICIDCIMDKHRQHQFEKFINIIEMKRKEFEGALDQVKQEKIPSLNKSLDSLMQNQRDYNQKIDQLINEIKSGAEKLKKEIDEIRDRLIKELIERGTDDQKYLRKTKDQIEKDLKMMRKLLKESEEKIKDFSDVDAIRKADDIKHTILQMNSSAVVSYSTVSPGFVSGQVQKKDLEQMYGHLVYKSNVMSAANPNINVNVLSSFKHNKDVFTIKAINPDETWVGEYMQLQLIDQKGNVLKTLETDFTISHIDTLPSGDILTTARYGHYINRISQRGSTSVFADMSPYQTYGLHVTKGGDVLVGLSKDGRGRVVRLSSEGQTKQVIESGDNNSNLFAYPACIKQSINGDIWFSEDAKSNLGVIAVDRHGHYRFTYRGPTHVQMEQVLWSRDLANNQHGQFLVADYFNSAVHFVDGNGCFLQYILTKQDGLHRPVCMTIDSEGKLWIGCNSGQVYVLKYLR